MKLALCCLWIPVSLLFAQAHQGCQSAASECADESLVQLPKSSKSASTGTLDKADGAGKGGKGGAEGVPQFDTKKISEKFGGANLCKLINYESGDVHCQDQQQCTDPAYAICCMDSCSLKPAPACTDYGPKCQARKAACEMASFLADNNNYLAQPALWIDAGTYPSTVIMRQTFGGYSQTVWKVLQKLLSKCYQLEDLNAESTLVGNYSTYTSAGSNGQEWTPSCPKKAEAIETSKEGQDSISSAAKTGIDVGEKLVNWVVSSYTPIAPVYDIVESVLGNVLLASSGPPSNPCTGVEQGDWGKCVYGQILPYVERFVSKYVKHALANYTAEIVQMKMHQIQSDIGNIKWQLSQAKLYNSSLKAIHPSVRDLVTYMQNQRLWLQDSMLLPHFLSIDLSSQSLALASGLYTDSTESKMKKAEFAANSVCYAKMVLKRATYLMQSRMNELKATQVNRHKWTTHEEWAGVKCWYYYPGQYDALCYDEPPDFQHNHVLNICWPGYPPYSPCYFAEISVCAMLGQGGCTPWDSTASHWFLHQAMVRKTQLDTLESWLAPLPTWLEIAEGSENDSSLLWDSESWDCDDMSLPMANLATSQAGTIGSGAEVFMFEDCPFDIQTSYAFDRSFADIGEGAYVQVSMWKPVSSSDLYYLGDTCTNHKEPSTVSFMNAIMLNTRPGYEDALTRPTGMQFDWNDRGTGGDTDGGFFTPICQDGYVPVGSVGEQFLDDDDLNPSVDNWPNLMCVKEEYTEQVQLDKSYFMWNDHGTGGHYDGTVFVGPFYNSATGVLVYGPCHTASGHVSTMTVYQLKEKYVKWCNRISSNSPDSCDSGC
ncbi:pmpB [Symbiodinium sp. CCMP2592]|nr:pmpB [Symbiodinium sp. CCMP2592]